MPLKYVTIYLQNEVITYQILEELERPFSQNPDRIANLYDTIYCVRNTHGHVEFSTFDDIEREIETSKEIKWVDKIILKTTLKHLEEIKKKMILYKRNKSIDQIIDKDENFLYMAC